MQILSTVSGSLQAVSKKISFFCLAINFVVLLFLALRRQACVWKTPQTCFSHHQNGKIFDTVFGRWGEDRPFRWSLASTSAFSWQAKWLMRMRWVDEVFVPIFLEADNGWENCGGISKIWMFRLDKGVVFPLFPMITRERVYSSWILWLKTNFCWAFYKNLRLKSITHFWIFWMFGEPKYPWGYRVCEKLR